MNKNNLFQLMLNPFNKIAGAKALFIGLALLILTIIIAQLQHIVFIGVISVKLMHQSLYNAFLLALTGFILFSLLLFIIGTLLSKSSIRAIDVVGTLCLSKAPLIFIALICSIPVVMDGTIVVTSSLLPSANVVMPYTQNYIYFGIFIITILISIIWMLILSYNAFSVSCNIKGAKAVSGFIAAVILTEIISYIIIALLISPEQFIPKDELPSSDKTELRSNIDYSQLNAISLEAAQALKEGKYEMTYKYFDSAMKKALPISEIEQTMTQIESQFGKLQSIGTDIKNSQSGNYRFVYIPCLFEKQKAYIQFTFNNENQISGFFIKP